MSVTGRVSRSEPAIQNLPGSFAHTLSWAFETGDFSAVWRRVFFKDFSPPKTDPYEIGDYLSGLVTGRPHHDVLNSSKPPSGQDRLTHVD